MQEPKNETTPTIAKDGEVPRDAQRAAAPRLALVHSGEMGKLPRPMPPRHRAREGRAHMTQAEYLKLREQVRRTSRNPLRDELLVQFTWLHFMRINETVNLRWADVQLDAAEVFIRRSKGSRSGLQRLTGDEVRKLRKLKRAADEKGQAFVFTSERGGPMAPATARDLIMSAATAASLPVRNPHSLRHGATVEAARRGITPYDLMTLLGHKSLKTTTEYLRDLSAVLPPTIE